jgi:ElaB/YqjD/DUF883 family membrane-anchored ribosome-binding protein
MRDRQAELFHVFGICRASGDGDALSAHGPAGVRGLERSGLAAVVADAPRIPYREMARAELLQRLLNHQRVLEEVGRSRTLLPVKFGTVLTEVQIISALEVGQAAVMRALDSYREKAEFELAVSWDEKLVLKELAELTEVRSVIEQAGASSGEEFQELQLTVGKLLKEKLEQRREEMRARLLSELDEAVEKAVVREPPDDSIAFHVSVLVADARRAELERHLHAFDSRTDGRFKLRCIGPLPPHSFCTVHIRAVSPEEVERARKLLGLPATASPRQARQAYRLICRSDHPDVSHEPERTPFEEVSWAHRVLSAYFDEAPIKMSRRAAERAVSVWLGKPVQDQGAA